MKFYDLHVSYTEGRMEELYRLLNLSFKIGYRGVAVSNVERLQVRENIPPTIIYRKNIFADNIRDAKNLIRKAYKPDKLIAVKTSNRSVASWCARDGRVRMLSLDLNNIKKLHKNTIKVASENDTFFELSLSDMVFNREYPMVKRISLISSKIRAILDYGADLIITSGAKNIYQIRPPKDIIALAIIFNLEEDYARRTLSEHPEKVLEKCTIGDCEVD